MYGLLNCALWSVASSLSLPQLIKDLSDYFSPLPFSLFFNYQPYHPSSLCLSSRWSGIVAWFWVIIMVAGWHPPPLTSSLPVFYLFFLNPLMIKWFSAQGGSSIVLLKDRIFNTSELHLQREESIWQVAKSSYCDINYQWENKCHFFLDRRHL